MKKGAEVHAAEILWSAWCGGPRIGELPASCRPSSRAEGYAVQGALTELAKQSVFGWKIAATSAAGQAHIGVDGPLAGRLHADRILGVGASIPLENNLMGVAEAEFAFRLGRDLPQRASPYAVAEVIDAVDAAFPAIEVPDSRFVDFATAGTAQLVADVACASWFVHGPAAAEGWRELDLSRHVVHVHRNGEHFREGCGANVLGDPRIALAWIANELCAHGDHLRSGQIVTTGTCVVPFEIAEGDRVAVDFGVFGRLEADFV